ncbi:MAG TPA: glycosyltransferase family 9 protein [Phycisphaerae bacterium]|nr:glycosyltransferase family 9 protein [Phycisphaerae bacterium]
MLLVLHQGAIGDFLLTLSVVTSVREHLRESHVEVIASAASALWTAGRSAVDRCLSPETVGLHTLFTQEGPLDYRLVEILKRPTCILSFLADQDDILHHRLDEAAAAGIVSVDPRPRPETLRAGIHITDQWAAGIRTQGWSIGPPIGSHIRRLPNMHGSNRVLLHPGGGGRHKCWPIESFVSLADEMKKHDHAVAWMLGPAECEPGDPRCEAVRRRSAQAGEEVIIEPDLTASAERIAASRLYIGNDGGMTHVAAATGVPTIAIFVATDPRVWRPLGKNVHVIDARTNTGNTHHLLLGEIARLIGGDEPANCAYR